MKRGLWGVGALCCVAFVAGGCAKKEMVKNDEAIVPTTATSKPVNAEAKSRDVTVKQQSVKESPIKDELKEPTASNAEIKAELAKIYFNFDASVLSPAARETLAKDAELLKKTIAGKVTIEGHCDERGADEYNLALGEKRAQAARQYLATLGVSADRLAVISYGKEKPADPSHDEAAWAKNRRDEFVVSH